MTNEPNKALSLSKTLSIAHALDLESLLLRDLRSNLCALCVAKFLRSVAASAALGR